MKTFLTIISFLAIVLALPATAAKKGKPAAATPTPAPAAAMRILQVDAASITVSVGESGNEHFTYRITDNTKVTLNGAPIAARDLRAGMSAHVDVSPDRSAALSIAAKDPVAPPTAQHSKRRGS